jgi:energy-coupling factor transporter ATP-binding protein EcfA2
MKSLGARITAAGFGFTYVGSRLPALSDLDLEVPGGSETWVTGPNAAGKSTLLAALAGVIPTVTEGALRGSLEVASDSQGGVAVPAMVMQDAGVYLFRTVSDEIAFPLENRGVLVSDLGPAVSAALEAVGIGHLEGRLMSTLSGGERQKVAVAAALAVDPDLLLLDEPFEQLDPASADEVLVLARARTLAGATLVVATREAGHVPPGARRIHLIAGERADDATDMPVAYTREPCRAGDAVLEMRGLTHRFESGGGIDSVDVTVRAGESVALLGPNGAGKTTLMKHAIGLLRPDSGTVTILGEDAASKAIWELARDVGLLFQNPDDQIFNRASRAGLPGRPRSRRRAKSCAS